MHDQGITKERAEKQKRDKQLISCIFLNIPCSLAVVPIYFSFYLISSFFPFISSFWDTERPWSCANSCDTLGSHGSHEAVVGPHLAAFRERLIFSQRESGTEQGVSSSQVDPSLLILFMMSLVKGYLKFEDG